MSKDEIKRLDQGVQKKTTITVKTGDYLTKEIDGVVLRIVVNKIHTSSVDCFVQKINTIEPGRLQNISLFSWVKMYSELNL